MKPSQGWKNLGQSDGGGGFLGQNWCPKRNPEGFLPPPPTRHRSHTFIMSPMETPSQTSVFKNNQGFLFSTSSPAFIVCGFFDDSGTPLQCSCLENPMDGGAWWAAVHGVTKSQARLKRLSSSSSSSGMGWEVEGRFKQEGTYVDLWLIHVDV